MNEPVNELHPRASRDIQAAPALAPKIKQAGPAPLKGVITVLSVLVLLVSGMGYFAVGRLGNEVASASNLNLGGSGFKHGQAPDGAVDILLVGSDSRTDAQGNPLSEEELAQLHAGFSDGEHNTDTIMLIRVPNDGSRATAVSIPRDTYVKDPDLGNMKINGVFSTHKAELKDKLEAEKKADEGDGAGLSEKEIEQRSTEDGRAALIAQVTDLTGIDIDHYAEVGLLGFTLLTEAVGGVDVCLNDNVDDEMSGAKFKKGRQTINGAEALAFVRQRYGLPRGDFDRIVRQQAFMASLVNKALATDTLTNPSKLGKIGQAVERSVVIDENWDIMNFASQLSNLAGGNVTFTTIPVTSVDGTGDFGESIVTIDKAEVHDFMDELTLTAAEASESAAASSSQEAAQSSSPSTVDDVEVHVLNAGSISGLAAGVGGHLESKGYQVDRTANAQPGIYATSQVVAADANDERASALAKALGGLPITTNPALDDTTLIVVTADDYAGPSDDSAQQSATADKPDSEGSAEESGSATPDDAPVGTPGNDFGTAKVAPEIDAGGDGPRCVN